MPWQLALGVVFYILVLFPYVMRAVSFYVCMFTVWWVFGLDYRDDPVKEQKVRVFVQHYFEPVNHMIEICLWHRYADRFFDRLIGGDE